MSGGTRADDSLRLLVWPLSAFFTPPLVTRPIKLRYSKLLQFGLDYQVCLSPLIRSTETSAMPRFYNIKFNLVKAIELLGDMNHIDMDVTAPPSSHDFFKEYQVAQRLHDCLNQMYRDGFFDDCDLREIESDTDDYSDEYDDDAEERQEVDDDDELYDDERPTPRSEGFSVSGRDLDENSQSTGQGSRESLSHRFKRYIKRILPGRRSTGRGSSDAPTTIDQHQYDYDNNDYDDDDDDSGRLDDDDEIYDPDSVIASDAESAGRGPDGRSRSRSGSQTGTRSRSRSGGPRRSRSASSSSSIDSRRSNRSGGSTRSSGSRAFGQRASRTRSRR